MFLGHVVLDDVNPSTVNVTLASERDGVVWSGMLPEAQGLRIPVENLSAGFHRMVLTATSTTGETGRAAISIGVCRWSVAESFDEPLDPNIWETFGDAYRASGGWLEMTGNLTHKKGSIFNIGRELNRGDTRLRFKVSTGQCFTPGTSCRSSDGADGFAMSVFDVDTVAALEALVADAGDGGCLMYGVSGVCGTHVVGGFHIEFDTWNNLEYDPTDADHVAITLDGNPGNHVLWTPIGDLENNQWHQVEVALAGEHIEVELDSHVVIEGDVPGFSFKGGFIGFSGTTGNLTNYHRFDDLQVEENCRF
jgi:hypothetical protein